MINSCTNSSQQERTIFKGTEGVEVEFIESIPDSVYEGTSFFTGARIKNLGPYTITDDNPGVVSLTSDEAYFIYNESELKSNNKFSIFGKSIYYQEGELIIMTLPTVQSRNMTGAIQNPKSSLYLGICYPYETFFSEPLCIDFDLYDQDQREKVCTSEELHFSGGQGAPIAVTKITPFMQNSPKGIKPQFIIEIENKDKGVPWYNKDKKCISGNFDMSDWGKVKINGSLSTFNLNCEPSIVKLVDNKGTVKCSSEGEFVKSTNFLTILNLNLDYNYIEGTSKDINILRMPQDHVPYSLPGVQSCVGKAEGTFCHDKKLMVCNEHGECENKCSYCARADGDRDNVDCKGISKGFACVCSAVDIGGIPLSEVEYENAACRVGLCCNPGLTEFKIKYSKKLNSQFSSYQDLPQNKIFSDTAIYRFKPYSTSDTAYYCMLGMYEGETLLDQTPVDICENDNYIEINPLQYLNKELTFISYAFERKDSSITDYKFSSKPYSVKFVPYQEANTILAQKIINVPKDDKYFEDLQPNYCAAFLKRLLRKVYGLEKYGELSTIGSNCLDSNTNGVSIDAWDIAACFLRLNKEIYVIDSSNSTTPLMASIAETALEPGDLIFVSKSSSWCKWTGYNYYKSVEIDGDHKEINRCGGTEAFRNPSTEGYCKQDSIIFFEDNRPKTCSYSENGRVYSNFPVITHIGIYLGDNKAAYYNNQIKIDDGTLSDFISSVNADGIRLIVRPNYPELSLN